METTGTAIMKKLSGDATAAVATGMKIAKAFEDMQKEGDQATSQAQEQAKQDQARQEKAVAKANKEADKNKVTNEYLQEAKNKEIVKAAEANRISLEHVQARQEQQNSYNERYSSLGGNK